MTATASAVVPEAGARIGDYEVIRELGRGGMAVILTARRVETEEVRAIN